MKNNREEFNFGKASSCQHARKTVQVFFKYFPQDFHSPRIAQLQVDASNSGLESSKILRMKSDVFANLLIHLHVQRNESYFLKWKHKISKFDPDCRNISGAIEHCLDIEIKRFRWTTNKKKIIFNQWRKQGRSKVYFFWHTKPCTTFRNVATQQFFWDIFVRCVRDLSHPAILVAPCLKISSHRICLHK